VKRRVLLDCDGVLADFVGGALKLINEALCTRFVHADVTEFDLATSLGLSASQGSQIKRLIGSAPRLAAGLAVLPGAVEGVMELRARAEVYIVTSSWDSNETWEYDRKAWLARWFDIPRSRIIFAHDKHVVCGDVLVDDKTSTLEAWRAAHPGGVAVQWQNLHNRRDAWDGVSTSSWDELCGIVEGVA
jgi:5'(3')-deoxyribonucleotidase